MLELNLSLDERTPCLDGRRHYRAVEVQYFPRAVLAWCRGREHENHLRL